MEPEKKIIRIEDLPDIRRRHDAIAMCSGCFDIMQSGHAVFFQQCKEAAGTLVVVVGRDTAVRSQKGPQRPINPENNRLYLVAAMKSVDYVILGEDELLPGKIDFARIAQQLRPDVFVVNADDSGLEEKRRFCEQLGIALKVVPRTVPPFLVPTSSTAIIEKSRQTAPKDKTVLVSGFFDVLHAGHIEFLEQAASLGRLVVSVGSDHNYGLMKDTAPLYSEQDRLRIVRSLRCVHDAFISEGTGSLDFLAATDRIRPDIFAVNADGHSPDKEAACRDRRIEYRILRGSAYPHQAAPGRDPLRVPYRLALAGGWIDQPWVSAIHPGAMVVARLEPTMEFAKRSGMATSTRETARRIWGEHIPSGAPHKVAKILFGAENPPGTKYIAGSQDAIGLVYPGISRLYYEGGYWPTEITSLIEPAAARWLEESIVLVPLQSRPDGYDPLIERHLEKDFVRMLADAGENCWQAIRQRDILLLGRALDQTLEAWKKMLPNTVPPHVAEALDKIDPGYGRTLSGAGGGYAIVATDRPRNGAIRIKIKNT
ncbi:MAG TPA: adenylyltransferase/cytidyltransferase family protein [Anaerohalosphaeraceae bacterium]|jgi:cytidyltransferase-like protein|nr:adenylyltransferase/cytidyltransferase family protein [Anaerohalosphaeraceae bacterium]HRT50830.1 adenylyltransferase/cytidyltransferase family protein [Anaerohalosphaeraceae bacterium]HRT86732.1 adenylyltransferase/cytidyltransferase family protein [Anaerohalosphaeraceae bacterium]